MHDYERTELIYDNPLFGESCVKDFIMEGSGAVTFPLGRMRLENTRDAEEGQTANIVYWVDETFPDDIAVSWDFWPIREPGLCIIFFAATGRNGEDVFDPALPKRNGVYDMYHHGAINALHLSYFRRKQPKERSFHTCNLRKSYGFHMVAQGADPLPSVADARAPYKIELIKAGPNVLFSINELTVLRWSDDGESYGPVLTGGKIGFRQMAPLMAEYANLKVHRIVKK